MTYPGSWFGNPPAIPSGSGSAGAFGAPETLTIAGGIAARVGGSRNILLAGQGGVDDSLDAITGYAEGDMVILSPSDGAVTITITDSVGMNLQGIDFIMDDINDSIVLLNQGTDTWKELSRSAN
jgi:hypothetical protein